MIELLRKFLVTFSMAISWLILAFCIHLSPAWGSAPVSSLPLDGGYRNGYGAGEAVQTLPDTSGKHPDTRDISVLIGKTAFENGDYDSGIMAFDRSLDESFDLAAADPASRSSSSETDSQKADAWYVPDALALNPQQEVESNMNRYLHAIKSSKKEHFLSAKIYLGLDLDDENSAPARTGIGTTANLYDAITVTVDKPEKGLKHTSTASFDYLYRPRGSTVSWKLSGMNYVAAHRDNRDLDVNLYDFKAGTSLKRNKLTWDVYGTTNHLSRGFSQYLRTYSAGTSVNYAFTSYFRLGMDGKLKLKNYFEDSSMDARNICLAVSPKFVFGRSRVSLNVGMEQEDSRNELNSYTKINGSATYEVVLPFASSAYVNYLYQGTEYKATGSSLDEGRMDEVHYLATGLTKCIPVWKSKSRNIEMDLNLNYTYTRSDSNIDLYAYSRNVLSSGMSIVF